MASDIEFRLGEGASETMKNLVGAMIGDFADVADKPDDDYLLDEIEKYIGSLPSLYQMGMVWILRAMEVAPLAMGYGHQFSNLSRDEQIRFLEAFEKSSNYVQRGVILALKTAVLLVYLSEPAIEHALGYDHKCLLESG